MSTICILNNRREFNPNETSWIWKKKITFFTSIKSVGRKTEVFCNLSVLSIGFDDEYRISFAKVIATDENYSLKMLLALIGSEIISSLLFKLTLGRSIIGVSLLDMVFSVSFRVIDRTIQFVKKFCF